MRSKEILDGVDFGRDLATTAEDNEQLWRIRELNRLTPAEYLQFLNTITEHIAPSRETSEGIPPFEL